VLTIHSYAMAEGWPTWRRSYPEDPKIEFLKSIEALLAWRDEHAKAKPVWVTEFGWDASTKPPPKTGDFAKWDGNVSDEKQAQYLVRAFLLFSAMDVQRAYLYFFNDSDEPSFHASSGITRNFEPKASFHAVGYLWRTLDEYRFGRTLLKTQDECYAFEFDHGTNPRKHIIVAWSPTGSGRTTDMDLPLADRRVVQAERMPLAAGAVQPIEVRREAGTAHVPISESPVYLWVED
jgi:hypothetical protein